MILKVQDLDTKDLNTNKELIINTLSAILVFVPIVVLLYIFDKYAINIPHWDDHPLKSFVLKFDGLLSIQDKITLIFSQHNEHRIGLTRLSVLLNYKLSGNIDFKFLMWVGMALFLGIFFVISFIFKKYNSEIKYLIPISFILIGIYPYENLFWAMASIQNFGVIFIAISCFYLVTISENKASFYLCIILTFLGVFTSGNGILIPIICALILLFKNQKKLFLIYFALSLLFVYLYFKGYQKPETSQLQFSLLSSIEFYKAVFAMVGSFLDLSLVEPQKRIDISMAIGIFLGLFSLLFFWQIFSKKYNIQKKNIDLFWLSILVFCIGTIVATTLGRLNYGIGTLLTSKYKIYSVLILCVFYIAAHDSFGDMARKRLLYLSLISSIGLWYYGYLFDYQSVVATRQDRNSELFNSHSYNSHPYKPVNLFTESVEKLLPNIPNKADYDFKINSSKNRIFIESKNYTNFDLRNPENGIYLMLKSEKNSYLYPLYLTNIAKKNLVNVITEQGFKTKYSLDLPIEFIDNGKYQLIKVKILGFRTEIEKYSQLLDIQSDKVTNPKQNW